MQSLLAAAEGPLVQKALVCNTQTTSHVVECIPIDYTCRYPFQSLAQSNHSPIQWLLASPVSNLQEECFAF